MSNLPEELKKIIAKKAETIWQEGYFSSKSQLAEHGELFAQATLDYLKEQKPVGWIDATKETPPLIEGKDYSENVWAICDGERRVMCYGYIHGEDGGFIWSDCAGEVDGEAHYDDDYNVTHWQPFPSIEPLYTHPISSLESENKALKERCAEVFDALETIEADLMKSNLFDCLSADMPSPDYMLRLHDATAKFRPLLNADKHIHERDKPQM